MWVFFLAGGGGGVKPINSSVLGSSMISYHFVKPHLQSSTIYKESEPEIELIMVLCKLHI